ncbi:hypothetical protein [Actinacidiphila oryziradicis]|uniref:Uncharacterized protein n=1 Tax=Actinacidiphila oryziradicis TaxID=2571141 RepID=A0A4U0SUL4_9ACTN|nr:hypothetical protein [Actinacidiphila oryziradicis]TKA11757.1 hypothetical protein FCI23_10530 [Actinacidiphila oryziradicis]
MCKWHASPRRAVPASRQDDTGEIRIPLALFDLDQLKGHLELVLSRVEAEQMYAGLSRLLVGDRQASTSAVR